MIEWLLLLLIGFVPLLAVLMAVHFLLDYPLQGDFLSKAKNPANPIPGVPWTQAMFAHCTLHGVGVALVTGVFWLGFVESLIHWVTDVAKCKGKISYHTDQFIHYGCKVVYALLLVTVLL